MTSILLACGVLVVALLPLPLHAADQYSLEQAKASSLPQAATQADPRDALYAADRQRQDDQAFRQILVVSLVAIAILVGVLRIARIEAAGLPGRDVIRAVVLIFIIYGTVALAVVVKTTETLTGVIGVLSAVAGYLFGRAQPDASERGVPR
jgi:hypothetical protein